MNISIPEILAIITGACSLTTAIFWGAFLLGKQQNALDSVIEDVGNLNTRMNRAGEHMSDLADAVQKLPDEMDRRFVPRHELGTLLQINGRRRMDES
jgi:hypothetical protein